MSMPNIPDIAPVINVSLEQAVSLLLTSIALEEISLSHLMDAEAEKIKFVVHREKSKTGYKTCACTCASNYCGNSHCNNCSCHSRQNWQPEEQNCDDLLAVNESVNSTLINMSKMQMLLQWKLENIERILPKNILK